MNTRKKPSSQYEIPRPPVMTRAERMTAAAIRRHEAREKKKADALAAKIEAGKKQVEEMKAAAIIKPEDWKRIETYIRRIKKEGGRLLFSFFVEVLSAKRKLIMGWDSTDTRSLAYALPPEYARLQSVCERYFRPGRIIRFEAIFRDGRNNEETARVEHLKKMMADMFSGLVDRVKYRSDYPVFGSQITAEITPTALSKIATK